MKMAEETKLLMSVPRDVIDAQVKAAVATALNKDPEALVRAVVEAAMNAKKNSYDRETVWQEQINEMIRAVAREEFKAWLETQRAPIAKMIREKLGKSSKELIDKMAAKMVDGFTNIYVSLNWPDSR
jgi:hypothetical protein